MKKKVTYIFLFITTFLSAQTDNINWSSIQLQTKLSNKTTLNIKPIFRFNDNISSFQNASIDLFVNHKFGKGWSGQISTRTWFVPDAKPRQFIWLDAAYNFNLKKLKIGNRLRYHWALNINDRNDADFIRWDLKISLPLNQKFTAYFGVEPWLRLDGFEQLQRIRYQPGISWKINKKYVLGFTYWREESINLKPSINTNIWLVNLLVKI